MQSRLYLPSRCRLQYPITDCGSDPTPNALSIPWHHLPSNKGCKIRIFLNTYLNEEKGCTYSISFKVGIARVTVHCTIHDYLEADLHKKQNRKGSQTTLLTCVVDVRRPINQSLFFFQKKNKKIKIILTWLKRIRMDCI